MVNSPLIPFDPAATDELRNRLLDEVHCGVVATDPHLPGNPIIYCNRTFTTITGYTAEEVLGRNCRFLQKADRDQAGLAELRSAIEARQSCRVELRNYRKNGELFWNELSISPVVSHDRVTHFVGIITDISHRKQIESALSDSQMQLSLALQGSGLGVWRWDAETNLVFVDECAGQLWDVSLEEQSRGLPVERFMQVIHEDDRDKVATFLGERAAGDEPSIEYRLINKNGTAWVTARGAMAHNSEGRPIGGFGTVADITGRKLADERIRELESELAHSWRVTTMGEMVTVLAHELNQPLTAIANYSGTCAALMDTNRLEMQNLRQALDRIEQQSLRAGKIINRLKHFVAKSEPRVSTINLNETVAQVHDLIGNLLTANQASLRLELDPALPPVNADPLQIQQVLVNLLTNAIEASSDSGRRQIVATTSLENDQVQVEVIDRGTGLAADVAERIFEPFATSKPNGLGMGLKISRRIIRAHGGQLQFRPNPLGGTIFSFALPADSSMHSHSQLNATASGAARPSFRDSLE